MLVANLPYNVATPLVLDLLDDVPAIRSMLVMVQREVGERLAAHPGEKAYGIPSVKVAYWATAKLVGKVPPTVFVPQPKVESVLVRIERRDHPWGPDDPTRLFELVRAGFNQRRKMLRAGPLRQGRSTTPTSRRRQPPRGSGRGGLDVEEWGRLAEAGRARCA